MVKLWLALSFALLAGLMVIAAGIAGQARASVVLGRAGIAFVLAAGIGYIAEILFERYGISKLLRTQGPLQQEELEPAEEDVMESVAASESATEENEGSEGEKGFSPLSPDGLRHVSSPQD